MTDRFSILAPGFRDRHLLTCEGLSAEAITSLLDLADKAAERIKLIEQLKTGN